MPRFNQHTIDALKHYVYCLKDPRKGWRGQVFYVGKGQGNRAFAHAQDALKNPLRSDKLDRIRKIIRSGLKPIIIIHRHGLDGPIAYHVEAALIDAFEIESLANIVRGHNTGQGMLTADEVIRLYQAPRIKIVDPVILIKIEREWQDNLTDEQLYERTRRYWDANPEKKRRKPRYALAVARGIVREVYKIQSWEKYPNPTNEPHDPNRIDPVKNDRNIRGRVGFRGVVAPQYIRKRYLDKSVFHLQEVGAQNPIRYKRCD